MVGLLFKAGLRGEKKFSRDSLEVTSDWDASLQWPLNCWCVSVASAERGGRQRLTGRRDVLKREESSDRGCSACDTLEVTAEKER